MENRKISKLVRSQLPDFIRSEHSVFVTFLEKYYEWMEQPSNPLGAVDELKNSLDVDTASDNYIDSVYTNLLPYFPQGMQGDKKLFLKHVNDFYSRKGSAESLKLAFRAFYGEEADVYYPKEDILKVSDGKWLLPLALRIDSDDTNFLNIEKTLLTGTTSKATAVVENITRSIDRQLGIEYIEAYISNIEKYFETGEIVTATYYDNNGLPVTVEGRLVGALSEIKINPKYRGLYYQGYDADLKYDGDPVTIVGGLNPTSNNPIGAIATVGDTTKGSVVDVLVVDGGLGFRLNDATYTGSYANTLMDFKGGYGNSPLLNAIQEAKSEVTLIDDSISRNVSITNTTINDIYTDSIANVADIYGSVVDVNTADPASNAINTMSQYESLTLHPISFIQLTGGGGGYREKPTVDVYSFYNAGLGENVIGTEDNPELFSVALNSSTLTTSYTGLISVYNIEKGDLIRFVDVDGRTENIKEVKSVTEVGVDGGLLNTITVTESFPVTISGLKAYKLHKRDIRSVGALGRLKIVDGGASYNVGDTLVFSGGSGYGANANVTNVSVLGTITGVDLQYHSSNAYIRGGEGYRNDALPTISIINTNGDVAGDGNASIVVTEILGDGEKLELSTSRIGAISTLRVTSYGYDYVKAPRISLRNMDMIATNVSSGLLFVSNTRVYQGISNTSTTFSAYVDQYDSSTGFIRLFDYQGTISNTTSLISDDGLVSANVDNFIVYGDGKARANANFENGLIRHPGIYINNDGHISSDKYIQDGDKYHNFSYIVNTLHDYNDFKKPFKEVFHPAGMKPFIIKTTFIEDDLTVNANSSIIKVVNINLTSFNVSNGSNTLISTNGSIDLTQTVNVGDTIILTGLNKTLSGTANIANLSNVVIGTDSNYIGELIDGDLIIFSTDPIDLPNTNYIISNDTVYLPTAVNDITPAFTRDLINYCSGQYVPHYFKTFIEQRISGRLMGDIVNEGYIGLNSALASVLYQQNIDIDNTQESWIENYIINYLDAGGSEFDNYLITRGTTEEVAKVYFVADTVTVDDEDQITIGNSAPVTANNLYIKLIYTDTAEVVNVSATEIIISHNVQGTSNNIPGIIHKNI